MASDMLQKRVLSELERERNALVIERRVCEEKRTHTSQLIQKGVLGVIVGWMLFLWNYRDATRETKPRRTMREEGERAELYSASLDALSLCASATRL